METFLISPWETIENDRWLPRVVTIKFAENPGASTDAAIDPPLALPERLPLMFRLVSLHVPEIAPRSLTTPLLRSNR
jgi:hypothetical protein